MSSPLVPAAIPVPNAGTTTVTKTELIHSNGSKTVTTVTSTVLLNGGIKKVTEVDEIPASTPPVNYKDPQQPDLEASPQPPASPSSELQTNYSGKDLLNIFLEATLGWTPTLWKHVKERNGSKAAFFFFLFVVDLADAVFDVVLGVQDIYAGSDGSGNLGILLLVMTILGRILSGMYGLAEAKKRPSNEELAFGFFAIMEMGVFFLEDGAAILVLAKSTGSPSIIEGMSTYLTVVCGLIYILYFVKWLIVLWVRDGEFRDCEGVVMVLLLAVLPLGGAIFLLYILATEVIFAQDDDPPLSGELEVAAFVVYGITAFFVGGYAMCIFCVGASNKLEIL